MSKKPNDPLAKLSPAQLAAHHVDVRLAEELVGHPVCGVPTKDGVCTLSREHSGRHL